MKLKIFKSGLLLIMAVLFVESFPLPAWGQIADNFTTDSSLNTSLWTTPSSLLTALATDTSSPPNTFFTPTLSFSSTGMQMTGVNGHYQFAGIQSLASFAPPFTLNTTVMGTLSPGNAFAAFLVNGNLSQWLAINGDLIPATCYQNIWINYTGSGIPLTSAGNVLYGNPSTNVWYTIQISVGTDGNASVVLMTNGVTIASQSGLSVGNGPFYIVLAQKEGWPCDSGPLAATWQSINVTSGSSAPPSFTPTDMATLNGTQENSITLAPNANLTGSFPYLAVDGSNAGGTMITVIGLVNSANQWVGGAPQVVYNAIPSQGGSSGTATWSNLAIPSSAGTYQLWFQTFLTSNTNSCISAFESSPPTMSGYLSGIMATVVVQGSNPPPAAPILVSPTDGALNVSNSPVLNVEVSDPDNNSLTVTFYGQVKSANAGPDFTIIALPDTQYYTDYDTNIFPYQTDWIITNRVASNIVYVTQLGDCVDDGDALPSSYPYEWSIATNALYRLESPALTGLPNGIPYGVAVGNHDETPNGCLGYSDFYYPTTPTASTTTNYNQYFGTNHFLPYLYGGTNGTNGYYGGYCTYTNNSGHTFYNGNNFYNLFRASGMDFIVLYLEYDETMTNTDDPRLVWANQILQSNANRRAIVVSHYIIGNPGQPDQWGSCNWFTKQTIPSQGYTIYNALKGNANLFLMLSGHVTPNGVGQRSDPVNGGTVTTLLSDYQDQDYQGLPPLGENGDGWLRIYTFSPSNNVIHVQTYSPYLSAVTGVQTNMTDTSNQFDIPYNMSGMWVPIETNSDVASGSTTSAAWPGLAPGTQYQWHVTVSDGQAITTGPVWTFTVQTNVPPVFQTVKLTGGMISFEWSAIPGQTYQLQYKTNLAQINWISLGGANTATDVTMSATDSIGPDPQRFYRVVMP